MHAYSFTSFLASYFGNHGQRNTQVNIKTDHSVYWESLCIYLKESYIHQPCLLCNSRKSIASPTTALFEFGEPPLYALLPPTGFGEITRKLLNLKMCIIRLLRRKSETKESGSQTWELTLREVLLMGKTDKQRSFEILVTRSLELALNVGEDSNEVAKNFHHMLDLYCTLLN